ncbi:TonB-dependent receptor domain-containing protein [Chitinophaga vietnamensis]|uniref:TonB-dependent receptor domain-containing protein n=1 Tax=Chitinophaga vietnamensis TaxID=2593957 RepID=UPI00117854DB|nr:TonB-dependent receptor [Chitinophaga vietnamensis]
MHKSIIILLFCLSAFATRAQQRTMVVGQVVDSLTRKPVEYATIVLMQAQDRKTIAHVLADNNGSFSFSDIGYGSYQVGITMLGYAPRLIDTFHIDSMHLVKRLGVSYLSQAYRQLGGVTVTGQRPLIEMKDGTLVYNVENDVDKDNASAAEIMRKVPMVTVSPDGTIRLKGQTNYKVLLNGRPTSIVTRNPKEALAAFPANLIKRIEIITEPSAKYEAEGVGGIINIITQKRIIGYNGGLSASYNTLGSTNLNGSFNAKTGKWGLGAFGAGNFSYNRIGNSSSQESLIPGNKNILQQETSTSNRDKNYFGSLELSYDIDSTSTVTLTGSFNKSANRNIAPQFNQLFDSSGALSQTGHYSSITNSHNDGYDFSLSYIKKFNKEGHELSAFISTNNGNSFSGTDNQQHNTPGRDSFYLNNSHYNNKSGIAQADYSLPLRKGQRLEAGIRYNFNEADNDYHQLVRNPDSIYEENPARANIFKYRQEVFAVYTTYRIKIGEKCSVQGGLRMESSNLTGDFISNKTSIQSRFTNLIPTLSMYYNMKGFNSLSFSYSRRVERPDIGSLNPYVNDNDPRNITYGNPDLKPSFTNAFGLYYNAMLKKTFLSLGLDGSFSNDQIQAITRLDSIKTITYTTYDNIGAVVNAGLNVNSRIPLNSNWNLGGNIRGAYARMKSNGTQPIDNSGFTVSAYLSTDYNFGHGLRADINANYNSGTVNLQGSSGSYIGYGFSVRKELLKNKASLTLSANQPFQANRSVVTDTRDASFHRTATALIRGNSYSIGFSWRFSKLRDNK